MNYSYPATAPRWGVFEVTMPGKTEGNPFTDYTITATFTGKEGSVTVDGFYDGDGVYKAVLCHGAYKFVFHSQSFFAEK